MAYTLQGEFFEVCDCEAVCSCWVEVAPAMGSCTGLFAWFIDAGTVDGVDVAGCKAMLLFNGSDCDLARHLMLLVDGGTPAQRAAMQTAITTPGPWSNVVRMSRGVTMPLLVEAAIQATPIGRTGKKVKLSVTAANVVAEAFCEIDAFELRGPAGSLIDRSTGTVAAPSKSIKAGSVYTDAASGTGLNLLATNNLQAPPYTFDVDITNVSAVRGKFSYTHP
jgi:hypothetical protein